MQPCSCSFIHLHFYLPNRLEATLKRRNNQNLQLVTLVTALGAEIDIVLTEQQHSTSTPTAHTAAAAAGVAVARSGSSGSVHVHVMQDGDSDSKIDEAPGTTRTSTLIPDSKLTLAGGVSCWEEDEEGDGSSKTLYSAFHLAEQGSQRVIQLLRRRSAQLRETATVCVS